MISAKLVTQRPPWPGAESSSEPKTRSVLSPLNDISKRNRALVVLSPPITCSTATRLRSFVSPGAEAQSSTVTKENALLAGPGDPFVRHLQSVRGEVRADQFRRVAIRKKKLDCVAV